MMSLTITPSPTQRLSAPYGARGLYLASTDAISRSYGSRVLGTSREMSGVIASYIVPTDIRTPDTPARPLLSHVYLGGRK